MIRWEPGAVDGSAGFNFLDEVRLGTPYEVADAQNIAQMICDPNGDGIEGKDHWGKTSFDLLAGRDPARDVQGERPTRRDGQPGGCRVRAVRSRTRNPTRCGRRCGPTGICRPAQHAVVAAAGRDQLDRPERERGSVLSSAKTYLTLVKDPIIAANTRRSDFRIMDLMNHERPVSLYMVTRGGDKERLRPLVRLLLTMAMRQLMGVELKYQEGQPLMPHRHRLLMMLDEFPSLGRLQIIQDALPKCAGYGIKAFLAAQNREQMFGAYGAAPEHHRQLPHPHRLRAERMGIGRVDQPHGRQHHDREGGRDRERHAARLIEERVADLSRGQPAAADAGRDHGPEEAAQGRGRPDRGERARWWSSWRASGRSSERRSSTSSIRCSRGGPRIDAAGEWRRRVPGRRCSRQHEITEIHRAPPRFGAGCQAVIAAGALLMGTLVMAGSAGCGSMPRPRCRADFGR